MSKTIRNDRPGSKPSGPQGADVASTENCQLSYEARVKAGDQKTQDITIGAWNVQKLNVNLVESRKCERGNEKVQLGCSGSKRGQMNRRIRF
jgi:hypothetical protein